ncbi:MAG TPA: BamA/TamA family outer membrane protein [Terriglobales bacterium]|nr:BamA/TamA family outer membrane protein [Terriglobales bacterium]
MTSTRVRKDLRRGRSCTASVVVAGLFLGLLFAPPSLPAQADPGQGSEKKDGKPAKPKSWKPHVIFVPDFYYRPETRLALGAGGFANYRLGKDKEHTRPSTVGLTFVYTMNNQMRISLRPEVYLPRNSFILNAVINYSIFPTMFYGIGNNTPASMAESYTPDTFSFQLAGRRKFFQDFFAGVQYQFKRTVIEKVYPNGLLSAGTIPGSRGGIVSGVGTTLTYDNRDNIIFPRRGKFFQLTTDFCGRFLGSDFNYTAVRLDLRLYAPVMEKHVLALQVLFRTVAGTAPFYDLSNLGGAWIMRGISSGRYVDKSLLAFQAEYRLHVWKRFTAVGFAGLGDVAPRVTSFTFSPLRYSVGGGLRFRIDSREGTNVRVDYAWARGSSGLYVTLLEAF